MVQLSKLYTDSERHSAHRHKQTDEQTDRRQYRLVADPAAQQCDGLEIG